MTSPSWTGNEAERAAFPVYTMPSLDDDAQVALSRPFPPEQVGQIPRGGTQLDYVGHAAVTKRLLEVDPHWSWTPMGYTDQGLPLITVTDGEAALWIRLTVLGVSRPGVGTAQDDGSDVAKKLISDAIRNAAMRFGVALDLWSKEDLGEPAVLNAPGPLPVPQDSGGAAEASVRVSPSTSPSPTVRAKNAVMVAVDDDRTRAETIWSDMLNDGHYTDPLTDDEADLLIAQIDSYLAVVDGGETPGGETTPEVRGKLGALLASTPTGFQTTKTELADQVADLYDLMWQADLWGPTSLVDDLRAANSGTLSAMKKGDLVIFAAGAWSKAEPEMSRLR